MAMILSLLFVLCCSVVGRAQKLSITVSPTHRHLSSVPISLDFTAGDEACFVRMKGHVGLQWWDGNRWVGLMKRTQFLSKWVRSSSLPASERASVQERLGKGQTVSLRLRLGHVNLIGVPGRCRVRGVAALFSPDGKTRLRFVRSDWVEFRIIESKGVSDAIGEVAKFPKRWALFSRLMGMPFYPSDFFVVRGCEGADPRVWMQLYASQRFGDLADDIYPHRPSEAKMRFCFCRARIELEAALYEPSRAAALVRLRKVDDWLIRAQPRDGFWGGMHGTWLVCKALSDSRLGRSESALARFRQFRASYPKLAQSSARADIELKLELNQALSRAEKRIAGKLGRVVWRAEQR